MTRSLRVLALSVPFVVMCADLARADVITFGNAHVYRLDLSSPRFEVAALATFFNGEPANVNDRVDFVRTGWGHFDSLGLHWRTIHIAGSDQAMVEGFVGPALVNSRSLSSSSRTFMASPGFSALIDRLSLRVSVRGSHAMLFDNVNLVPVTSVPEPSTLVLCGAGLAALGLSRRRRRAPGVRFL